MNVMSKKISSSRIVLTLAGILLAATAAMPAFAQLYRKNNTEIPSAETPKKMRAASSTTDRTAAQMSRMIERANKEIDQRVGRLTELSTRIQGMKRISESDKANIQTIINGEITELTNLKAKIAADTDTETLRADFQSITKAYRIYALIMPQIAIFTATNRVGVIADAMSAVSQKLSDRITAAQTAGNDVTALQSALSDMNAKITDAKTQADAARAQIITLAPDNGDQTVFNANKAALKSAHEKVKTAMKDLETARKDAQTIVKGLKSFPAPSASASAQPSASPVSTQ